MHTGDFSVLDFVDHPVFVLEPGADGLPRYAWFNDHACAALGLPRARVLGRTAAEIYPGRLGQIALQYHKDALQSGLPVAYEIQLPLAGGQGLVRTTLRPMRDADDRILRIYGSSAQVADRQIVQTPPPGEDPIKAEMEQFINLAAHDLRTPMRQVAQLAELLREECGGPDAEGSDLIDALDDVAQKSLSMIGDMLNYAQTACAAPAQTAVAFEFRDLVQEVTALLDPLGRCRFDIEEAMVQGDPTATRMILHNLIDNSLKYATRTGSRGAALHLSITVRDGSDGFYEVTVCDNGTGFGDPALVFLQGGKFRVDSGFGLLGVRRLIHARNGSLKVANRSQNQGAVVSFALPGGVIADKVSLPQVA